ncbi:MAG TPA: glycosyltransferase family A protein [Puia sp.]|nr:glycosyltransferase family A protein [Puia sp.]
MKKISICTVCMNRLNHLSSTLPVNIGENQHLPHVEFVLLDYNSSDGLETWVKDNLSRYIDSGILKYYKTCDPAYFETAHSRNMAIKLASGDIFCMTDADNFTGPGYIGWVDSTFSLHGNNTVITTLRKDNLPYHDQGGKFAFSRELLYSVNGYDESVVYYGMEDVDLANRLEKAGGNRVFIEQEEYLKHISHSDEERFANFRLTKELESLYISVAAIESAAETATILYLLKDATFIEMNYAFNKEIEKDYILSFNGWRMVEDGCRKGSYKREGGGLALDFGNEPVFYAEPETGLLISKQRDQKMAWKELTRDEPLYYEIIKGYGECYNRIVCEENERNSKPVNPNGWGLGTVYLNFDTSRPVKVL